MENNIQITIKESDVRQLLEDSIKSHPHKELIVNSIIGNLNTSNKGLGHLFKAFMGIDQKSPYVIGSRVLVKTYAIYSSLWDKTIMEHEGLINDGVVSALVVDYDEYKSNDHKVIIEGLNSTKEPISFDSYVSESYITGFDTRTYLINPGV